MEDLKISIGVLMILSGGYFFYRNYKDWLEGERNETDELRGAFNLSIFGKSVVISWTFFVVGLALVVGWF